MPFTNISEWNSSLSLSQCLCFSSLQETKATWGKWNVCTNVHLTDSSGADPVHVRTTIVDAKALLCSEDFYHNSSLKWNF